MAGRAVAAARLDRATRELMQCRNATRVVALLTEQEGLSRRQAQRIVGKAYQQLQDDLTEAGVSRAQMAAQLAISLQDAIALALERNQPAAVAGCAAQLQNLLGLGVAQQRSQL